MTESQKDWQDEHLRILGLITVNFSALEQTITMFIAQLMIKARASSDSREINFQFHLALLIAAELPFYKLLTLLESLYKHIEPNPGLVSELVTLLNRAGNAANQRDVIVHSAWLTSTSGADMIRLKTTAKKEKNKPTNLKVQVQRTSQEGIGRIADFLWEVYKDINNFMVKQGYTYIKSPS